MKLQDFHVEIADWSRAEQRSALLDLREVVFIREQGVSEQRERDGLDADCWHVLARDEAGQPIGCGRLTPAHKIGRMAVLREWRGRGVGVVLLRELVARARAQGWPEVALDAQVSALGFYQREGFVAYGEEFEDAGLMHRAMRLSLSAAAEEAAPPRDIDALPAGTRSETAAARLQLLADARHQLSIHLPLLGNDSYACAEELAELRRIATSGRGARIRILLHDPAVALRNDHRLVALAQRLPSAIQVRTPVEEADLACISACLLNDAGGYLFLPEADRAQGRAARRDRASQAPLQQHFDELWERAERASELQALGL
ncbi:GNAT family N-acetyltransferase [Rhodanobacter sp. FW106-PBR-R2A-1-13]|uniref:GNAT family N-acetyltransferase n=1 Tax=Rhodanobacter sp. FW106-PBR-R2A-1-13 TaxID=3454845 RepID=UPI001209F02D|nr:MAG: GNAT family N-acetyltransferase [Rhodanobacter sp.]